MWNFNSPTDITLRMTVTLSLRIGLHNLALAVDLSETNIICGCTDGTIKVQPCMYALIIHTKKQNKQCAGHQLLIVCTRFLWLNFACKGIAGFPYQIYFTAFCRCRYLVSVMICYPATSLL